MKIVISGGGTGGHIYPALALIKQLKKQHANVEVLYIGTENGLEKNIVQKENIPFKSIEISGFKRKISLDNIKTVLKFLTGINICKKYLKDFQPDIVVGTGGYVCGPVVYAAAKLNIPTMIHEQNSIPGLTNKFLSRYVNKIAISFEDAKSFFPADKVVLTGNPRATQVMNQDGLKGKLSQGLDPNKRTVLIVGGSRGAKPINDAFISIINQIGNRPYQFLYVTGDAHFHDVEAEIKKAGNLSNVIVKPYVHNMPEVLAGVDLIVCRSGATTLAEITALGIPSILIPSPYVTNNHQEKNARSLGENGAAIVRMEKEMNGTILLQDIDSILLNEKKLTDMRLASLKLGIPDAAEKIISEIHELIK